MGLETDESNNKYSFNFNDVSKPKQFFGGLIAGALIAACTSTYLPRDDQPKSQQNASEQRTSNCYRVTRNNAMYGTANKSLATMDAQVCKGLEHTCKDPELSYQF